MKYLVAIYRPDDYNAAVEEDEEMGRNIDALFSRDRRKGR